MVNVSKGIEEGTLCTLAEQIREELPQADVAVLSGPSHAEEVSLEYADGLRGGCSIEEDGGVCTESVHESGFSCIYQPGYPGD